jgi:hypothetical protein
MHDWPGRAHLESLRAWPELVQTAGRIEAVTQPGRWEDAWEERHLISAGALVTFDRFEDKPGIAGHSWLTPALVKVECLITEPGGMRIAGDVVVLLGEIELAEKFERKPAFTREEIDGYAAELRETNAISAIERAYGDLIALLRPRLRG